MKATRHLAWLVLLLPVALGLVRIRLDVEVLNLLPSGVPVVEGLKRYQQNFSNARELVITLDCSDPEKAEAAARAMAQTLRARSDLVQQLSWQPAWMEYPEQSAELIGYLWLNQSPEKFGQLTNRLLGAGLAHALREAREHLATSFSPNEVARRGYDPLGLLELPESAAGAPPAVGSGEELFASADRTFRLLFVEAAPDLTSYRQCVAWLGEIKAEVQRACRRGDIPEGVQSRYTGRPAFVAEIAGGMERDMFGSVTGTGVIIAALFYLVHRRWRPLLWLLALLGGVLGATLALGGLVFGALNVVSLGFAAILLGLAVDYGLVLYQEAVAAPETSLSQIRRDIAPSIIWSAATTAGAFAMLNLSSLPGLAQLGSLVAIGVALAALIMLSLFLLPLLPVRTSAGAGLEAPDQAPHYLEGGEDVQRASECAPLARFLERSAWAATLLLLAAGLVLLWKAPPRFDRTAEALKPRRSEAHAAVEQIKARLGRPQEPLWVLIPGASEEAVAASMAVVEKMLENAVSAGWISSFNLPTALWPSARNQMANRPAARVLCQNTATIRGAALAQGFTTNSLAVTEGVLDTWQRAATAASVFWPTNPASRWALAKVVARSAREWIAVGTIHPATHQPQRGAQSLLAAWPEELARAGVVISAWELVGPNVFVLVKRELPRVLVPMGLLLVVSLWLAFRRVAEVLLSLASLAMSALALSVLMHLAGWSWNLLNMMALPLLLGAGVDYSIHIQLGLRRHGGDVRATRRTVGRALLLCAATTVTGFGSLAWSDNAGLASLGQVCSIGIACTYVTSIFLLPAWWKVINLAFNKTIRG